MRRCLTSTQQRAVPAEVMVRSFTATNAANLIQISININTVASRSIRFALNVLRIIHQTINTINIITANLTSSNPLTATIININTINTIINININNICSLWTRPCVAERATARSRLVSAAAAAAVQVEVAGEGAWLLCLIE